MNLIFSRDPLGNFHLCFLKTKAQFTLLFQSHLILRSNVADGEVERKKKKKNKSVLTEQGLSNGVHVGFPSETAQLSKRLVSSNDVFRDSNKVILRSFLISKYRALLETSIGQMNARYTVLNCHC